MYENWNPGGILLCLLVVFAFFPLFVLFCIFCIMQIIYTHTQDHSIYPNGLGRATKGLNK